MSSSLYAIDKLDDSNYSSWCVQMRSILVHSELWDVVAGLLKEEGSPVEISAFKVKDAKALATLTLCIKTSQIIHIKHCKASKEAWDKLQGIYKPQGPAKKISLFKQLLQLRFIDGTSMFEFLNEFCKVLDSLNEINVEIPDEMVEIILLTSLPESYENFIVAMETRDKLPTLNILKGKLLEEGVRRQEKNQRSDEDHAYLVKTQNYKKSSTTNNNNNFYKNHANDTNNNYSNGNRNTSEKKHQFRCYNCNKRGHFASECRLNKKKRNKEEIREEKSFVTLASTSSKNILKQSNWCIDSGATSHLCSDRSVFINFKERKQNISLAGEHSIVAEGVGNVKVTADKCNIILKEVLYVPNINCNFLSVSKITKAGFIVKFTNDCALIKEQNGLTVMKAKLSEGLFMKKVNETLCASNSTNDGMLWHSRYGHLNFESLNTMAKNKIVSGLEVKNIIQTDCVICAKSKLTVKPFQLSTNKAKSILELVHSDICGPIGNLSNGGAKYFITFIDDKSRFISIYFLKSKDEAFECFKKFKALVENQTGKTIKILRTDNGREYVNKSFGKCFEENGIQHQLTVPHTPQQNGVAERANRTLVEMARCLLVQSKLGENFWAEATATAVYLRNRATSKSLNGKTPFEVWFTRKPNVSHLKVFGCVAVAIDKTIAHKFKPKGKVLIMVGYSEVSKAYRLYNPENRKIFVSRDVQFFETKFHGDKIDENEIVVFDFDNIDNTDSSKKCDVAADDNITAVISNTARNTDINSVPDGEERSVGVSENLITTSSRQPIRYRGGRPKLIRTGVRGRPRKLKHQLNFVEKTDDIVIPQSFEEATKGKYRENWMRSMDHEYNTLVRNETWELAVLPREKRAIKCKWVYNIKKDENGQVIKFKSRLVAKGCNQRYGVDYKETFSPVVRYATIRLFLALACEYDLNLHQLDVAAAYINSELHDEVYIKQPEGYINQRFPEKVLKLKKALYGLKQSGREWNTHLDSKLRGIGFQPCISEPCVYIKNVEGNINIIMVYVDDLILGCTRLDDLSTIKNQIAAIFEIVDGGILHYFLGMEIDCGNETITLCQRRYIEELLVQHRMEECKGASTPLDPGFQAFCGEKNCKRVDITKYQSLIGALMYLALATRPDIIHSVCKLAQYVTDPHTEHEAGARHIIRYLHTTKELKIHYNKTNIQIYGTVDADWANDQGDRKSYTGCTFIAAGAAFYWESKKQNLVALSSTEAEYIAMSMAAKEAVFVRKLMGEMGFPTAAPTVIYGDNQSAQKLIKNPMYHARSKHIDIKYHFVRELYKNNEINLKYVST